MAECVLTVSAVQCSDVEWQNVNVDDWRKPELNSALGSTDTECGETS